MADNKKQFVKEYFNRLDNPEYIKFDLSSDSTIYKILKRHVWRYKTGSRSGIHEFYKKGNLAVKMKFKHLQDLTGFNKKQLTRIIKNLEEKWKVLKVIRKRGQSNVYILGHIIEDKNKNYTEIWHDSHFDNFEKQTNTPTYKEQRENENQHHSSSKDNQSEHKDVSTQERKYSSTNTSYNQTRDIDVPTKNSTGDINVSTTGDKNVSTLGKTEDINVPQNRSRELVINSRQNEFPNSMQNKKTKNQKYRFSNPKLNDLYQNLKKIFRSNFSKYRVGRCEIDVVDYNCLVKAINLAYSENELDKFNQTEFERRCINYFADNSSYTKDTAKHSLGFFVNKYSKWAVPPKQLNNTLFEKNSVIPFGDEQMSQEELDKIREVR